MQLQSDHSKFLCGRPSKQTAGSNGNLTAPDFYLAGVVCLGCFCVRLVVWVLFLSCASILGDFQSSLYNF